MIERSPSQCPECGLYMSFREEDEQGMCNYCLELISGPIDTAYLYNEDYEDFHAFYDED